MTTDNRMNSGYPSVDRTRTNRYKNQTNCLAEKELLKTRVFRVFHRVLDIVRTASSH